MQATDGSLKVSYSRSQISIISISILIHEVGSGMKVLFSLSSGEKALLVEYIVFLQTSSEEISSETLDFINLQSNMVEGTYNDSLKPSITEDLNGNVLLNLYSGFPTLWLWLLLSENVFMINILNHLFIFSYFKLDMIKDQSIHMFFALWLWLKQTPILRDNMLCTISVK